MSAIVEYMREAWPKVSETVEDVLDNTREATVSGMIFGAPTWLSRQVDDWSLRTLPPATAKVVAAVVVALPLVILNLITPGILTASIQLLLGAARLYYAVEAPDFDTMDERDLLNWWMWPNGVGLAAVLYGIVRTANGIFKKDPLTGCFGAAWMLFGFTVLHCSAFLKDAGKSSREIYEGLFGSANVPSSEIHVIETTEEDTV